MVMMSNHKNHHNNIKPSENSALTCAVCRAEFEDADNLQLHIDREHVHRSCDMCAEEMTYVRQLDSAHAKPHQRFG